MMQLHNVNFFKLLSYTPPPLHRRFSDEVMKVMKVMKVEVTDSRAQSSLEATRCGGLF